MPSPRGLLRRYGKAIGLPPGFTIHDRADAEDLLYVVRTELGLAKTDQRFPRREPAWTFTAVASTPAKARTVLIPMFPW